LWLALSSIDRGRCQACSVSSHARLFV
jgi:hypothetical protein